MYLRIDKLQIELQASPYPDPSAAAAVQDLLGGRFGEMSTLMNYTYQDPPVLRTCLQHRRRGAGAH